MLPFYGTERYGEMPIGQGEIRTFYKILFDDIFREFRARIKGEYSSLKRRYIGILDFVTEKVL
jgi:hypothetical protein